MNRKTFLVLLITWVLLLGFHNVHARDMEVYVDDHYLVRDVQSVEGFDMLPLLDIAGELGYSCSFDGTTAVFYNDAVQYTFQAGNPSVFDQNGQEYGLDVVPQMINGKFMVPAKFFCDVLNKSYVWDEVTDTLFLGSESSYEWLVSTPEYQEGKKLKDTQKAICGVWYNKFPDETMEQHSTYIEFKPDGTFFSKTWRVISCGTYTVTDSNKITVSSNLYFDGAGSENPGNYYYDSSSTDYYELSNGILINGYDSTSYTKIVGNTADIILYAPDRRVHIVSENDIQAWLNEGWYTYPVSYVYAPDGRCEIISADDISSWEAVGWTTNPYVPMYALDGRVEQVKMWEVPSWESVGWYTEPVIKMYSEVGKTCIVKMSEIDLYKSVGWYEAHEIALGRSLTEINRIFGGVYYTSNLDGGYIYKSQDMCFGFPINPSDNFRGCTLFFDSLYKIIPESILYADENGNIDSYTLSKNTGYLCEMEYSEENNLDTILIYIDKYVFLVNCDQYGNFNIFDTAYLYLNSQSWSY